ncbi:MAG: hypothetical protein DYG96_03060 [Chlorobi bacterium CHB2]|nr:hypothetical protein [Chlorobi bacterium CHB2]
MITYHAVPIAPHILLGDYRFVRCPACGSLAWKWMAACPCCGQPIPHEVRVGWRGESPPNAPHYRKNCPQTQSYG